MIQRVFIVEQDGNTRMLLKESNVAHHLRATPYRFNAKIDCKQWAVVKMVGKMPMEVCVNADVGGGILPTLPYRLGLKLRRFFLRRDFLSVRNSYGWVNLNQDDRDVKGYPR